MTDDIQCEVGRSQLFSDGRLFIILFWIHAKCELGTIS